jgi:hypothetical protein
MRPDTGPDTFARGTGPEVYRIWSPGLGLIVSLGNWPGEFVTRWLGRDTTGTGLELCRI